MGARAGGGADVKHLYFRVTCFWKKGVPGSASSQLTAAGHRPPGVGWPLTDVGKDQPPSTATDDPRLEASNVSLYPCIPVSLYPCIPVSLSGDGRGPAPPPPPRRGRGHCLVGQISPPGGGGGGQRPKKFDVPKIGFKFPALFGNFIFCWVNVFLMWGWPGPRTTPPPHPPRPKTFFGALEMVKKFFHQIFGK